MRLLLDTHALIWLITDDKRLLAPARKIIVDPANDVFVSIVSLWEMAVKMRIGKLTVIDIEKIAHALAGHGLFLLQLEARHIGELVKLPFYADHRDPFDHQLIAQAIVERLVFMTVDRNAGRYAVQTLDCTGS